MKTSYVVFFVVPLLFNVPSVRGDYATEVLADNPVAYYRLGDAMSPAVDETGNGNNADAFEQVTFGTPSVFLNDANPAVALSGNGRLISAPL